MFALTNYLHMKPHPELWQHSPSNYIQYCSNFIMNKIFWFVSCLPTTFRDLSFQVSLEEVITRR